MSTFSTVYRVGNSAKEMVGFASYCGLAGASLDIEHEQRDTDWEWGPLIGLEFSVKPVTSMKLYSRFSANYSLNMELLTTEIGASVDLMSHLSFFGGWRRWDYSYEDSTLDVELKLSGLVAGMLLSF